METAGGQMLRAALRQLSTAAAVRAVPTPCRARQAGTMGLQTATGERTPPLGMFLGLREAVPSWGDVVAEAGMEVWDLDDDFSLPPPLMDMLSEASTTGSELGSTLEDFMDLDLSSTPPGVLSPHTPEGAHEGPTDNEIMHRILMERLASNRALFPLAAAVLAGGRRFPAARAHPGPRPQAPKGGEKRCMRLRQQRQRPVPRGPPRGPCARDNMRQPARGR